MRSFSRSLALAFLAAGFASSCGSSSQPGPVSQPDGGNLTPGDAEGNLTPGQTDFTTEEQGSGNGQGASDAAGGAANGPATVPAAGGTSSATAPGAPSGRDATVQEADIYRIDSDRLFYFNTYRGLLIYDLTDPKNPKQLSRLPVYGYPIEMFVAGNTVYALLSDALYLTEVNGKLQFDRHYVSQLVAIDVSDLTNPRVISTVDIIGELREGVSRKIDNTIYLVSYISQSYYWGWGYEMASNPQPEQAWVYSFDVSDPKVLKQVGQLQIFQGGSVQVSDPKGLYYYSKTFSDVTISATSNALMVAENWWVYGYTSTGSTNNGYYDCGSYSYSNQQQSVVSVIDVSDPKGNISLYTRFEAAGQIGDQFKMTYVFDSTAQTGTFYGIFARQGWSGSNCTGSMYTQNTLESWDITDGSNPVMQSRLDFGQQNETVAGSTFDVDRSVAYAVTARTMDPLYALSFADPKNLKILSAVDGLSGNMDVFRLIGDNNFLLGIGQDTSSTCTGLQGNSGNEPTNIAVSIIDVRDLTKVRLVQRQCVAVQNAEWVGSDITWNLDQAHKMIGMYSDSQANVVTVPVYYWTKSNPNDDWWWYQYKSAVGIMTWDLTKYDDTKDATQQTVLQNYGTFIHPNGEVRRTIVFGHQATGQRMMVNLSDTHASIASLQDLANPQLQSIIEIAPYYNQIYGFGSYLVAEVQSQPGYYYSPNQNLSEFRVLVAGGDLDGATPVASFSVGQVQQAVKHGNQLLLFRYLPSSPTDYGYYSQTQVLVYDLTDPTHPRRAGSTILPSSVIPYYPYWCGWGGYWGGYWWNGYGNWTEVESGLVTVDQEYVYDSTINTGAYTTRLVFLDLSNADAPSVNQVGLPSSSTDWNPYTLVGDPVDPTGFYLGLREAVGQRMGNDGYAFTEYKYYAQRWNKSGSGFVAAEKINIPGPLVRTWAPVAGSRYFMTQDQQYVYLPPTGTDSYGYYRPDTRLNLLREVGVDSQPAAELLDTKVFSNMYLEGLTVEGNTMYVTSQQGYYGYGYYSVPAMGGDSAGGSASSGGSSTPDWQTTSDRLMIFDLSKDSFATLYDQPTKAYNLQIMGANQNRLFLNLSGDGILAIDVSNPAQPIGVKFLRTLGWASYLEAFGDDLYTASGYFGLDHMSLAAPADIPQN
jgi:hypothetical protein